MDFDAREAAKEAARRSGLTLGEWINTIIAEQAAELGVEPAQVDADTRLEAVAARLAHLTHRAPAAGTAQRKIDRTAAEDGRPGREEFAPPRAPFRAAVFEDDDGDSGFSRDNMGKDESGASLLRGNEAAGGFSPRLGDSDNGRDRLSREATMRRPKPPELRPATARRPAQTAYRETEAVRRDESYGPARRPLQPEPAAAERQADDWMADERPQNVADPEAFLSAAIDKFDERTRDSQKKTATALAKVAQWIETSELRRDGEREALDKVAERLNDIQQQVSRRDSQRDTFARDALNKVANRLEDLESHVVQRGGDEQKPVHQALVRLETRLDALARRPAQNTGVETSLRDIDGKISALNTRLEKGHVEGPRAEQMQRLEAKVSSLVENLSARKLEAQGVAEPKAQMPGDQPPQRAVLAKPSVNDAIAAIARRQRVLDEAPQPSPPQPQSASLIQPAPQNDLDRRLEAIAARLEKTANQAQMQGIQTQAKESTLLSGMQAEISGLAAKLEEMRNDSARAASKKPEAAASTDHLLARLRQDMADMSAIVGNLAPRSAMAELETAMRDLGLRIEASRDSGTRESLLAPIEQLAGNLRGALDKLDPRASLEALHRDIQSIHGKVEGMTGRGLDRASFERVQAQSQEIRDLLAAAIVRPLPVANIERQIVALAERIEQISAHDRLTPGQKPDLSGIAGEIQNIVDRALPRSALQMLERRLEALDSKIDEAISRSPGTHHLAELALRMDDVQRALVKPQAGPDLRPLEQMMRDLSMKLESAGMANQAASSAAATEAQTSDSLRALQTQLATMTERLERSHQGLAAKASSHFDTLSQRMDAVQEKVSQPATAGDAARADQGAIEGMLRDLSETMISARQPDASMQVLQAVETQLGRIAERLERSNQGLSALSSDTTTKLDSLSRHIDTVQASVSRQLEAARAAPMVAPDSSVGALEDMVRGLSEKIDAARSPHASLAAINGLEAQVARMAERMEIARAAPPVAPSLDVRLLEDMVRGLHDKFEAAQSPHATGQAIEALETQVMRIAARLEQTDHGVAALGSLERSVGDLFAQIEDSRHATIDAAENAARIAARDTLRDAMRSATAQATPELTREIAHVRSQQDEADRRTHSTLSAVHETLEKVVDRLAVLESEVVETRPALVLAAAQAMHTQQQPGWLDKARPLDTAATEPFAATRAAMAQSRNDDIHPQPAAVIAKAKAEPDSRLSSLPSGDDEDFLIEPGQGMARNSPPVLNQDIRRPDGKSKGSEPTLAEIRASELFAEPSQAELSTVDKTAQQNFIAAARRAAQAAALQSVADINAPRSRSETILGVRPSASGKTSLIATALGYVASRKRVFFLAGVSLLVVFGAVALIRTLDIGGRSTVKVVETVKDTAKAQNLTGEAGIAAAVPSPAAQNPTPAAKPREGAALDEPAKAAGQKLTTTEPAKIDSTPVGSIGGASPKAAATANADEVSGGGVMKLAQRGNVDAQFEAGARLAEGRGVTRDAKAAAVWFEKAASQGLAPAQYRLGTLLEKGIGVPRDIAMAKVWYQRAAEQGHGGAMHNLAVLVADGNGGKPDYAGAKTWFSNAAEHGVRDSQFNLAILYARGLGVGQDLVKSYVWFTLAANQGDEDAAKKRADVASRLDNAQLDQAKAEVAAFRPQKLEPAVNEVAPPPGGWDAQARTGEPEPGQKDSAKPVTKTNARPKA